MTRSGGVGAAAIAAAATLLPALVAAGPAAGQERVGPDGEPRATAAPRRAAVEVAPPVRGAVLPDAAVAAPRPGVEPFRRPPSDLLQARRSRLLDALGSGVAVLRSADREDLATRFPQASSFRQDNDFLYLTGLETPRSWLVLSRSPDGGTEAVLYVPGHDPEEERWTGPDPGLREAARISGIEDVRPTAEFERAARAGELPGAATSGPRHLPSRRDGPGREPLRSLAEGASDEVRAVEPLMAGLRLAKDDFELAMLRRAVGITDRGLRAAMAAARPGMYEYELEARIEYEFRRRGAERVGFPSILGSGPNSVILHYDESRRRMEPGDLVVVDVGAEYSYYTADVTRTLPVSGRFTERQRALYRLVLGAQRAGLEAVRPGATLADVERATRSYLEERSGDLCGEASCAARFVHGVGHWLGMSVHDVGATGTPFRPGMVLTVEPGIYLPDEDLGIRIEDDVLVTDDGHEVLSKAPRTADEVEAAMARGSDDGRGGRP